jgi:microcystin-dependent protein
VTLAGADTELTYTTDYTVAVNSDGIGGVVTLVDPAAVGTGTLTVYRTTTNKQESDYDDWNQFPADTIETDLDIRTMISQEQSEELDRTLKLSISSSANSDLPYPESNKLIGWNGDADGLANFTADAGAVLAKASQAQAEAGTENDAYMTPLRTSQAITALGQSLTKATEFEAGFCTTDENYMTPTKTSIAIANLGYKPAVGTIHIWAGNISSPPEGFLVCDGSTFSSSTYPILAAVLGDKYGVHSGTNFYLPNFTNRFPYGASEGSSAGNASVGSANTPATPGPVLAGNDNEVTYKVANGDYAGDSGGSNNNYVTENHNLIHPYLAVAFIIKVS